MPNEGFLQRWSRLKAEPVAAEAPAAAPVPAPLARAPEAAAGAGNAPEAALPTLADAAQLNAQSDFSAFVARGVDPSVRRLAMKKLFADPHFNLGDGLDIYMGDYNVPSPVSAAMLASLSHARSVLARIDDVLDPADDPSIPTEPPAADTPALPPTDQEAA
jgi:hypothetical protein